MINSSTHSWSYSNTKTDFNCLAAFPFVIFCFRNPNYPVAVDVEWPVYNMSQQAYLELDKDLGDHSKRMYFGARENNFWRQVLPNLIDKDDTGGAYPCETSSSSQHVTSLAAVTVVFVFSMVTI